MKNRLVMSVRNKLRRRRGAGLPNLDKWEPIFEHSPGRSLSAPSRHLCAVTDIGKRRSSNEDSYYLSGDGRLWIVADGMGGHAAGELASTLTIQAIVDSMASAALGAQASVEDRLSRAFAVAHDRVVACSLGETKCRGMGSTAIAGVVHGADLIICHVGDVRAYHLSSRDFRRITNDHSWVWEKLVMTGLLTPDQARSHPERGIVTQAIGSPHGIKPALNRVKLKSGDRVLLCSDGLWEAVSDQDMDTVVGADGSIRQLASALVDRANVAGGADNVTAILYEHDGRQ